MPMKNPPHPGDLIKTEVIEALGLNVSKAADILKVRRATLSDLLHGKAALTPEMALRIEKAFGPDMDHLLRMQLAYDVAKTREHARVSRSSGTSRPEGRAGKPCGQLYWANQRQSIFWESWRGLVFASPMW